MTTGDETADRIIAAGSPIEIAWASASTVARNLAVDESLVRTARETGRQVLRFWWGGPPAVVLGSSERPDDVIDSAACSRLGVVVVKRSSGGGAVLQTSGVLNYSLVTPVPAFDITAAFRLGARLICSILDRFDLAGSPAGVSDVAVGDRKISGNAQAWRSRALLLHGTLLVEFDFDLVARVLRHPPREPAYRAHRTHRAFLVTLRDLGVGADRSRIEQAALDAARSLFPNR